ncbi:cell division protein FtsL [Pectinatus sottacetonis]|uniref:cell division protein FtsL n=1 Tax=Pectinatus sottacetonis TaxID=1002795 RepID=UPI0018C7D9E3|nr:cell division protein FtsL [Pectinatus sottacetonis]
MSKYYTYGNLAENTAEKRHKKPVRDIRHYKTKQLNTKLRSQCLLLVVVVAAMAMFIIFRNSAAVNQGYQLVKMKSEVASLEQQNARLRLDIAQLKSPERIRNIAINELGMVLPPKIYFANKNH